jgi:hypothetical protein
MSEEIREVAAGDGYPLAFRAWQTGEADTLVVTLHGIMTHSAWFAGLAESTTGAARA